VPYGLFVIKFVANQAWATIYAANAWFDRRFKNHRLHHVTMYVKASCKNMAAHCKFPAILDISRGHKLPNLILD